jgi:hypothetical protein
MEVLLPRQLPRPRRDAGTYSLVIIEHSEGGYAALGKPIGFRVAA